MAMTNAALGLADRIDEHKRFKVLVLIDGSVQEGDFVLARGVGELAYAGSTFVVNMKNQAIYPLGGVLKLTP